MEKKKKNKKKEDQSTELVFKVMSFVDKYRMAIYGAVGGFLVTLFVVIIIWPDRIAKLENGKEPVAQINGLTVTAEDLYEDMKKIYSISSLLDKIDNKILTEKYPDSDELTDEVKEEAEAYYNSYKQYYNISKEEFLSSNGFGSEKAFLEYLKLQKRRQNYSTDYIKSLIEEKEVDKFYEKEVYGDIKTKHILVKTSNEAKEEDLKEAENLAKEIIEKLNSGKTYDEIKDEYKDKITTEELGYKSYNANLDPAYMKEMESLENNSYSKKPIKTSYGYHIVFRLDQKEKPKLEDVKTEIIDELVNKKLADDKYLPLKALVHLRKENELKFHDTVLEDKYNTYIEQSSK